MHRGIAHTAQRSPHAPLAAARAAKIGPSIVSQRLALRRPAAGEQGSGGLDESTLARLRQAEEETARLRAELASLQQVFVVCVLFYSAARVEELGSLKGGHCGLNCTARFEWWAHADRCARQ